MFCIVMESNLLRLELSRSEIWYHEQLSGLLPSLFLGFFSALLESKSKDCTRFFTNILATA